MAGNIRLIGVDLDGTLLNGRKQVTPRTRRALVEAEARGVLIVPVTGRPESGIPAAVRELPGFRYAITSNGATIRDVRTGRAVLRQHLSPALCLRVLEEAEGFSLLREAFRDGVGYLEQRDYQILTARYAGTPMLSYLQHTRRPLPGRLTTFLREDPRSVEELFFLTGSVEEKQALEAQLSQLPGIGFADPFPTDLEVIAKGIDKGEALLYLARQLGISPQETMGLGDGGSDVPLLCAAGIGVAMENGVERLKQCADFVTTSCEEDGVAVAIEKYVLSPAEPAR